MSCFLGQASGFGNSQLQQSDDRVMPKYFQWYFSGTRCQFDPWDNGMLWPSSKMGQGGSNGFLNDFSNSGRFESDQFDFCGGAQVVKIIGTTLDSNGQLLGNCIVQGYVTSTKTFVGQVTSDTQGYYELPTTYKSVAHYLVAYLSGSPDVGGTTVNTIIPV